MALRVNARDFAKITGEKSGNKYNARRTEYAGEEYDSAAEATRAVTLDLTKKAGAIRDWSRQPQFELGVPENIYRADFAVTGNDGQIHIEDVKGKMTPKFRHDIKLWKAYGPYPLHIICKSKTIIIKGGKHVPGPPTQS